MRKIQSILFLFFIPLKSSSQNLPNSSFIMSFIPSFAIANSIDSNSNIRTKQYALNARLDFYQRLPKSYFLSYSFNLNTSKDYLNKRGTGLGADLGLRKFWNIDVYNKRCKPVFRNKILFSSKLSFYINSYRYNGVNSFYDYRNSFNYYGLSFFPICVDFRVFKRWAISLNYQRIISFQGNSVLATKNAGISYLIDNK